MKKLLIGIVILFLMQGSIQAQDSNHLWGAGFITAKIAPKWSIVADLQWRSRADFKQTNSVIIRPGINYHFNKNLSIAGGYAWIPVHMGDELLPEHRTWEQLIYTHQNKIIGNKQTSFTHRLRLEQRWIPTGLAGDGPDHRYANRGRYFIRTLTPLFAPTLKEKTFFLSIQNEVFMNFKGKNFDQNRAYFAAGYRFHSKLDGEMGYMRIHAGNQVHRNILQVAGYLRL